MKKPAVSVITAFLNEEQYLAEAIESVIGQQFSDWELILVDDGSTDDSTRIARTYAAQYPGKIFYTEHEGHVNKSTAASRNLGIQQARGELVAFLDADDVWMPYKLLDQVSLMQAYPEAAMTVEASNFWNSWQNNGQADIVVQVGTTRNRVFDAPELAERLYPLVPVAAPCPSSVMVRRKALIKHGGFEAGFTGKYQLYEDQAFLIKFYLNERVYISSLCNNKYRQRAGSCVQRVTQEGNYHVVRKYFLDWLQQYMDHQGIKHANVRRLLRQALDPYNRPLRHYWRKGVRKLQHLFVK